MRKSEIFASLSLLFLLNCCELIEISNENQLSLESCNEFTARLEEVIHEEAKSYEVAVRFTTNRAVEASIYYRPLQDNHFYRSEKTSTGTDHQLKLKLLRPSTEYEFFVADETEGCRTAETFRFTSFPLPDGLRSLHLTHADNYPAEGGFILSHVRISEPRYFFLTDQSGSIVWYHLVIDRSPKVYSLSEQNTIVCMLGQEPSLLEPADQVIEIDLEGKVINHITEIEKKLHHDIIKKNGYYHAITYEERTVDLSQLGGSHEDKVLGDGILVLDQQGNKIWEWSVFDVKNPLYDPAIMKRRHDWLHMNALWLDDEGNYYLSFRNTNGIWKVSGASGELIWEAYPDRLSGQHSIIIEDGYMKLFNNGLYSSRSSYEEYPLTPSGQLAEEPTLVVNFPDAYFTYAMGSAYRIEDLVLFCSTINGSIMMTDQHGKINWMVEGSFFPFRAYFIAKPYANFKRYLQ
jgi:hypothetical protein